jgi:hypothetical protein
MRIALVLLAGLAACGDDGGGPPDAGRPDAHWPDQGRLHLTWTIADTAGPSTCAALGVTSVFLREVPVGSTGDSETTVFPCSDGQGTTQMLPTDAYDVVVELVDDYGGIYDSALRPGYAAPDGSTSELDPVDFVVEPLGRFTLHVDTSPERTCTPETDGGAGVTALSLRLWNVNAACALRDLEVGAGATTGASAFTAETVCTIDASHTSACIEADQLITSPELPHGSYTLQVVGWETSHQCYQANLNLVVESGLTTSAGALTLQATDAYGCIAP